MQNSKKYHFADFTRSNYRRLLKLAAQSYVFRTFQNYKPGERFVLWRHDVDFSIQAAKKLAVIESEEGVRATYFFHLHNTFYNLLEKENTSCVREIIAAGHEIGLHFDPEFYGDSSEANVVVHLERERFMLEDLFSCPINVFSFHNPSPFTFGLRSMSYSGLINTYSEYFQQEVGYCSDSNGYWRHRRLEDVLLKAEDNCLQVLTHPAWWQDTILSPRERIWRCIDGRAEKTKYRYTTLLKEFGRKNIDWK